MKSKISIAHDRDAEKSIFSSLDLLDDLSELFYGKHVAIKPNETWASKEDVTACTQPDALKAVIRYVKQFEPAKITVTGGSGDGETDEIFHIVGLDDVIKNEGVEFFDHNRGPFEKVDLSYGPQSSVMVNPYVFEYDTVISLTQLKVHWTARVTLTMKNIAMSFPAADYYGHPRSSQKHPHDFYKDMHGFIDGMCQKFPIHLGILTGHPAMVGKGPIGGHTFEAELCVAGRDCVSTDYIGARLLGYRYVRHICDAEKLGIGVASPEKIELVGIPLEEAQLIFKKQSSKVAAYVKNA